MTTSENAPVKTTTTLSTGEEIDSFYFSLLCAGKLHGVQVKWVDDWKDIKPKTLCTKGLTVDTRTRATDDQQVYDQTVHLCVEQVILTFKKEEGFVNPIYISRAANGYHIKAFLD